VLTRFYRVFTVITFGAAGLAGAALLFNMYFNRLAVANFFVNFSSFILLLFLGIVTVRYGVLIWFAYLQHIEHMQEPPEAQEYPFVTLIVPAYNEGVGLEASVQSLIAMDYPRYEIVVVDDGSSDDTYAQAMRMAGMYGHHRIRVITQPNGGKASALNNGISNARGELIVCMDGDSRLEPQTLKQAVKHFSDPSVGAVAGDVKVVNRLNTLTKLQALEYIEGLSLVRTAHAFFRRVMVIPGPIGVFRKSVLEEVGGYFQDTYAEDCELTLRILFAGWKVKHESRAVAWTEAPENLQAFFKQRYRWSRGTLQAVIKHKSRLWKPYPNVVDWVFLWLVVFESMVWPGMDVFGIAFFVFVASWVGLSTIIILWWAQLTVLDIVAALFCLALEKEDLRLSIQAVLYRLCFIPYLDVIKFFASIDEIFGVKMGWGKLERFGRI
jgi:biofilm PGA synthesis N-glycosyltransferase PgaC